MRHLLTLVFLILPSVLPAQESVTTACRDVKTTLDMERCASRDLKDAKRDLARYLQEAHRFANSRALLDSTQAAWERFRDMACRAAGTQYEGGTIRPLVVVNCLMDLTRKRTRELYEHYLRNMDTKLSQPKP